MKKILFALPILVLLAAGCNATQQTNNSSPVSQNTAPTPVPTITAPVAPSIAQIDASSWQTYTSKEYGFQFQYPADWTVNDASYTYQGNNDLSVNISSPLISGVPGASRDAYFYTAISNSNSTWQHKEGMNLSLLKSDGGAIAVSVSQQYLESRPEYNIAQTIFSSIKNTQQAANTTNRNYTQNLVAQVTNWSAYQPLAKGNQYVGSDPCDGETDAQMNAMNAYMDKVNTEVNVKSLIIDNSPDPNYGGQLAAYVTPNYQNWTTQEFIAYKGACSAGSPYTLFAYPDKVVWLSDCGGGVAPDDNDPNKQAIIAAENKCQSDGDLLLKYFHGLVQSSSK